MLLQRNLAVIWIIQGAANVQDCVTVYHSDKLWFSLSFLPFIQVGENGVGHPSNFKTN